MDDEQLKRVDNFRVAVFGFYGNENLGDEAIVEAVLANIRATIPGTRLRCVSVQPVDSAKRHGVKAESVFLPASSYLSQRDKIAAQQAASNTDDPEASDGAPTKSLRSRIKKLPLIRTVVSWIRSTLQAPGEIKHQIKFTRHIRGAIGEMDALLIAGSNQFLDNFGGPFAFPYTLWRWTTIAKRAGVPIVAISVGAGPISSRLSMWLIHKAIGRVEYLSLRDIGSVELLGLDVESSRVQPDLAFSHQSPTVRTALTRSTALDGPPVIAINPMAVHARGYWYEVNDEKYEAYVRKLAQLVQLLEERRNGFIFISNQPRDELVIEDVISKAVGAGSSEAALRPKFLMSTTVEEYFENASKADIIIATRFHATVLALLLARPVIGLCYYRKSADLLARFGLHEHAFDIDTFSVDDVINGIDKLTDEYDSTVGRIVQRVEIYREQLQSQYLDVSRILTRKL
jgi:polysaccharide pyruvyl transferase WcaK-like protein